MTEIWEIYLYGKVFESGRDECPLPQRPKSKPPTARHGRHLPKASAPPRDTELERTLELPTSSMSGLVPAEDEQICILSVCIVRIQLTTL